MFWKKFNFFDSMFHEIKANPSMWKMEPLKSGYAPNWEHKKSGVKFTLEETHRGSKLLPPMFYRWEGDEVYVIHEMSKREIAKLENFLKEYEFFKFQASESENS